jgi:hypothetical protein
MGIALENVGVGGAGADHVHADAAGQQFLANDPRHCAQACLGGGVGDIARHRGGRSDRSGDDDGPAISHQRQCALDGKERAAQVDAVDAVPEFFGHVRHHGETADARIDEQYVDPAECLFHFRQCGAGLDKIAHVAADGQRIELFRCRTQSFGVAPGQRQFCAFGGKHAARGQAYARRAAEHQHALVSKTHCPFPQIARPDNYEFRSC